MPDPVVSVVPPEICDALHAARRVLLVGHVTPDADCLGSMGALSHALTGMGKRACASLPQGSVSRRLAFLADAGCLAPAAREEMRACDLIVVVDTAKASRVNLEGKLDSLADIPVVNVDHHATNPRFGQANWVDAARSSTAEMIYEVLAALGAAITAPIATLLYAGIHTDTQGFSLPNTTPRSLEVAHALAAAGVNIPQLCERLHRSYTPAEFALLRLVYANTRVSADGRIAWSTAGHDEIRAAGCTAADIDDQVNVPRSIEGIHLAMLFTEGHPGKVRINFRGERVEVLTLAQQFNGGGHHQAAGAILDGSVADVSERVLRAAADHVRERRSGE